MLFQGCLVCTALGGMLAVDEGIIFLAVLVGMGEGYFDVLAFQVDNVVKALAGHIIFQQIFQTVTRDNALAVVDEGQTCVQVSVVTQQCFYKLVLEAVVEEQGVVRLEEDVGTGFFLCVFGSVALQYAPFEDGSAYFTVAVAADFEMAAQCVDGFDTYTVQSDAFLERL